MALVARISTATVWNNIVATIGNLDATAEVCIEQQILNREQRDKLLQQIESLEKVMSDREADSQEIRVAPATNIIKREIKMNIQSHKDKGFISQLVGSYSIDKILTDISDKEQEMGTYFLHSFADLRFHPVVFKHEGIWCINIHKDVIPQKIKDDEGKMSNVYESLYANVIGRINLIERLQYKHLIYLSTDIKKKYSVNISALLPEARKIEDPRLCELLDKFENTKIYPSDELCRLVANDFKSEDEKKYWKQYYLSVFAVIVAIALPIILNKCTSTKIDEEQVERIINVICNK